jgi:hypothetical protein
MLLITLPLRGKFNQKTFTAFVIFDHIGQFYQ